MEWSQLFIIGFQGSEVLRGSQVEHDILSCNPGGVILFDRCVSSPNKQGNVLSPDQLKQLVHHLHELAPTPLLTCVDQEGGLVQRLNPRNGFPSITSAEMMGATGDDIEHTRNQAQLTARTLQEMGINVNFAPVVDLNLNRDNPIIGKVKRSFSSDPDHVTRHAAEWITCHRNFNIISCLKHFPGHGSSEADSHLGFVDITATWKEMELVPYQQLIAKGLADMVMVGHLYNKTLDQKYPATLSHDTVTGILRRQLGYTGVVVTDDMQMKAITARYGFSEAICQALTAGVDMIVIGNNLEYRSTLLHDAVKAVETGIRNGVLHEKQLTKSLNRVKLLKQIIFESTNAKQTINT